MSKTKRFGNSTSGDAIENPGPGQYDYEFYGSKSFNQKTGSSAFAKPIPKKNSSQLSSKSTPGPGHYNTSSRKNKGLKGGVFSSSTSTRGFAPTGDGPAPGQYENPLAFGRGSKKPQSVFRSTVTRGMKLKTDTPGPGAYESQVAALNLQKDLISYARPSSMFRSSKSARGNGYENDLPGPGSYYNENGHTRASASSSVFRSSVHRGFESKSGKPPGPGRCLFSKIDSHSNHRYCSVL